MPEILSFWICVRFIDPCEAPRKIRLCTFQHTWNGVRALLIPLFGRCLLYHNTVISPLLIVFWVTHLTHLFPYICLIFWGDPSSILDSCEHKIYALHLWIIDLIILLLYSSLSPCTFQLNISISIQEKPCSTYPLCCLNLGAGIRDGCGYKSS